MNITFEKMTGIAIVLAGSASILNCIMAFATYQQINYRADQLEKRMQQLEFVAAPQNNATCRTERQYSWFGVSGTQSLECNAK